MTFKKPLVYSIVLSIASLVGTHYSVKYDLVFYSLQVIYPIITLIKLHKERNYPNISIFFYAKLYSVLLGSLVTKWSFRYFHRIIIINNLQFESN